MTTAYPPYLQVEVNGVDMLTLDYIDGETVGQPLQRITDEKGWRYTNYSHQPPQLQSAKDGGRVNDPDEITVPGQIYYLAAWITEKVST